MGQIKNIYCLHHSHFDVGYTHHQELITELQIQYIDQAIEICENSLKTNENNPLRWTIEATLPLSLWLKDASDEKINQLKKLVDKQVISITALPFHTTPLNDSYQIKKLLETKKEIENQLKINITTAINHDINGQPWSFSDMLLDAGVDFYLTGENIHFGGIPFPRPKAFYWQTPSQRQILSFLGEHYSLFSQFLNTDKRDVSLMKKGLDDYLEHLNKKGYEQDFIALTATNPPLLDNNAPDTWLLELVNEFNRTYDEFEISFVTPEMLREKVLESETVIESKSGDWTDFWNFGSGSTPKEVIANREAIQNIKHAEMLSSFKPLKDNQFNRVKERAIFNSLMYNEHTWGAAESITEPYSRNSESQMIKKANYAYEALAQSSFILNKSLDNYNEENLNNEEISHVSYTNLGNFSQTFEPEYSKYLLEQSPYLSALKSTQYYSKPSDMLVAPAVTLKPLETVKIPTTHFKEKVYEEIDFSENGKLETTHYTVYFDQKNFVINRLVEKKTGHDLLSRDNQFGFFDLIIETINPEINKANRSTFFPRDIELANYSISVWNHEWQGNRELYKGNSKLKIEKRGKDYKIIQIEQAPIGNVEWLEKELIFKEQTKEIQINVKLKMTDYLEPISHYLSIPTGLKEGWESIYESADTLVSLDKEQLENVSKDWVTIGSSASFFDENKGLYLASKDSPLLQFNEFQFGKENKEIKREENPLFLSWIYNNYWDTNFKASEDGVISYSYLLHPFETYDPVKQYEFGEKVREPIVSTWSTKADGIKQPFNFESESAVLLSSERIDERTLLFHIKNVSKKRTSIEISSDLFELLEVRRSNLLGNHHLSVIDITDNKVTLELNGNENQFIQVKVK